MNVVEESSRRSSSSLSDRWFRLRNRILSSGRFQRWAARFPLTRFIARRRAAALFDLCAGFVYSQVLQAVVRLGVLELLAADTMMLGELAPRLGLSVDSTRRLLDAAVSLKLCERRRDGRYGLGIHGASYMGNHVLAAMVDHHALVYRDLSDPVALLRGQTPSTELSRFWSYADHGPRAGGDADVAAYSALMASTVSLIAEDVIEAYPQGTHQRLLDVGGGEGAFLEAVASHAPSLSLMLFDLPPVVERARERFARAGLTERTQVFGGNVFTDSLPKGADIVSLVRVIHDHDDQQALQILRAVRQALPAGGVLLLAEPMAGTPGAERVGDAYFGFYLLAMGQGRARTPEELRALLLEAGFSDIVRKGTRRELLTQLLVARANG